jgi:DNA-binding protein H-NS
MKAAWQEMEAQGGRSMSAKKFDLEAMSVDNLWSLHERISGMLSTRIKAEKHELEKRLAILSRGLAGQPGVLGAPGEKPRRRYPVVLPKYRNPQTSETWSGRGKRPRWLTAAMKSGRKIEEFRIHEINGTGRQRAWIAWSQAYRQFVPIDHERNAKRSLMADVALPSVLIQKFESS